MKSEKFLNILFLCVILPVVFFPLQIYGNENFSINENKYLLDLNRAFDLMFSEDFEKAEKIFIDIKNEIPEYPLGYFSLGTYYSYLLDFYESEEIYLPKIEENFNKTIEIAETLLENKLNKSNHWLFYYIGVAKSNNAYLNGKDGSYFSAIGNTLSGISYIEDCLEYNPKLNDAKLVLGSYMYYKSGATHWFYDSRDEGIKLIQQSIENSFFSRMISISGLVWIYIDYERYDDALKLSDLGLDKYPNSRYFLWGKAVALSKKELFNESNEIFLRLKKQFKMDIIQTNYNLFNAEYRLAKNYFLQEDYILTLEHIAYALKRNLSDNNRERLEDRTKELVKLKGKVEGLILTK